MMAKIWCFKIFLGDCDDLRLIMHLSPTIFPSIIQRLEEPTSLESLTIVRIPVFLQDNQLLAIALEPRVCLCRLMRAHHTTRLFSWLPIPSQWAGRVLKFTSILFHDIFIKLPSLNCISGLHGFFLCLHTIVNRAGYMELSVGYFAFQCSLFFFSGGSLCVHPFIRCFSRFLPCISPREFSLCLILSLRES